MKTSIAFNFTHELIGHCEIYKLLSNKWDMVIY